MEPHLWCNCWRTLLGCGRSWVHDLPHPRRVCQQLHHRWTHDLPHPRRVRQQLHLQLNNNESIQFFKSNNSMLNFQMLQKKYFYVVWQTTRKIQNTEIMRSFLITSFWMMSTLTGVTIVQLYNDKNKLYLKKRWCCPLYTKPIRYVEFL
jgi:hypothetical protein